LQAIELAAQRFFPLAFAEMFCRRRCGEFGISIGSFAKNGHRSAPNRNRSCHRLIVMLQRQLAMMIENSKAGAIPTLADGTGVLCLIHD